MPSFKRLGLTTFGQHEEPLGVFENGVLRRIFATKKGANKQPIIYTLYLIL
jgi:hypothetical protein